MPRLYNDATAEQLDPESGVGVPYISDTVLDALTNAFPPSAFLITLAPHLFTAVLYNNSLRTSRKAHLSST